MKYFFLLLFVSICSLTFAQNKITITVSSSKNNTPIASATLTVKGISKAATDSFGLAVLHLTDGSHMITTTAIGFKPNTTTIVVPGQSNIFIQLEADEKNLEDVVVVSSTRNNQRIENSPLKVEVLGKEEMNEENTIKPGNIASILGDVSGVQIQQSSAVSGNANVRIQGLDGRYTQILRDGMPLFEGFSGGFGILSIPPLDLRQIELIKGSASTLYGGGAIGGLVNIISKKPQTNQEAVVTANLSTLKESNINTFLSKRNKQFGYTFFGGCTRQKAVDVNKDGFSDVPDLNALMLHPRLLFYPSNKTTITLGYSAVAEKRKGGDMLVLKEKTNTIHQYFEENKTTRNTFEFFVDQTLSHNKKLYLKSSFSNFNRKLNTNEYYLNGRQNNYFAELSLLVPSTKNSFVAGINVVGDDFRTTSASRNSFDDFYNNTIGAFAQQTWKIKESSTFEIGLRDDYHQTYGNFLLPRIALFHRINEHWATRAGIGLGYKTPNLLSPQTIDYELWQLNNLPTTTKAEKSIGYNAEVNYKTKIGDNSNIFINQAFFLTQINKPIIAQADAWNHYTFVNASKPLMSKGLDTYIKADIDEWELYAGYTFTIAERKYLGTNQFAPLTPKHRMAFTLVRDFEGVGWRTGLEGSYTGPQYRFDNSKTPGYMFVAAMVEKKLGKHISIVLNGENLLDFRQSKKEPLYTGTITHPTFVGLWAPIDGRIINCSAKWHL